MSKQPLTGKVALVTGASRGIGKGIALALGEAGAIVYVTGRTDSQSSTAVGSLQKTVDQIKARGGNAISVACDHAKDTEIEKVFQQIVQEQGRLDILVNNVFAGAKALFEHYGKPFWTLPNSFWTEINFVGLRSHYISAMKAAKIMVPQKSGLMVNISADHRQYVFNPSYGAGKAGLDKIAADCGLELERHGVTFVSLAPGPTRTEFAGESHDETKKRIKEDRAALETLDIGQNAEFTKVLLDGTLGHFGESPEFSGKCIVALFQDPALLKRSGKTFTTVQLGEEFNLLDIDGTKVTAWQK